MRTLALVQVSIRMNTVPQNAKLVVLVTFVIRLVELVAHLTWKLLVTTALMAKTTELCVLPVIITMLMHQTLMMTAGYAHQAITVLYIPMVMETSHHKRFLHVPKVSTALVEMKQAFSAQLVSIVHLDPMRPFLAHPAMFAPLWN